MAANSTGRFYSATGSKRGGHQVQHQRQNFAGLCWAPSPKRVYSSAWRVFCVVRVVFAVTLAILSHNLAAADGPRIPGNSAVTEAPAASAGSRVRWGGVVVALQALPEKTVLEIAGYPLDSQQRPDLQQASGGRFLVLASPQLASSYRPGRIVTVTGILTGKVANESSQGRRVLPLVRSQFSDLWPGIVSIRTTPAPASYAPTPVYYVPYDRPPSVLPWIVPLAVAGALLADQSYFSFSTGFRPYYGPRRYGYGYGYRAWRYPRYGAGGVRFAAGFRF
jgi:outer membrane lipoprotein